MMHVYLLPLGDNRYDLYCEMKEPTNLVDTDASPSVFARWRKDFVEMVRAAEPDQPEAEIVDPSVSHGFQSMDSKSSQSFSSVDCCVDC